MRTLRLSFALVSSLVAACAVGNSSDRSDFGPSGGSAGAGGGVAGAGGSAGTTSGGKAGTGGAAAGVAGASGASGASGAPAGNAGQGGAGASGAAGEAGAAGEGGAGQAGMGGAGQAGAGGAGAGGAGGAGTGGITGASGAGGFATCATGDSKGEIKLRPVDIIWVVDNSASMKDEVSAVNAGIADFAASIGQKGLDYKVIMLSLRGKGMVTAGGASNKWGVCVPMPLAGDANCGNGPSFFHAPCDIRSTQPLEQLLGTLGQTKGYDVTEAPQATGDHRGSEPWKQELRADATKSFVVVTDDSSRLSSDDFLHFKGGKNPNSMTSFDLPPGILDASWKGLFDSWVFHAIYGWDSETDPTKVCATAANPTMASWFLNYTNLVKASGGARAKVCDGASAWGPFFDAISKSVVATSKISCEIPVPPPPNGQTEINPDKVNVVFVQGMTETALGRADLGGAVDCSKGGWHYDDPVTPTKIVLCPTTCSDANAVIGAGKPGEVKVLFGCNSVKP